MSEKNITKTAGAVSIGGLIVQAGGALGQFLYVIWLTPADFGLWAAASAAVALVGSVTNAGEANAYLASRSSGISGPFRRSARFNYLLGAVGLLIAIFFAVFVDLRVAPLIAVLAFGLPLQGRAAMLVAVFIKTRSQSKLISYQVIGTLVRLSVGIFVAIIWQSPFALALSYISYSAIVVVLGNLWIKRFAPPLVTSPSEPSGSWSLRVDRAVHQFSQILPHQSGYLTTSMFASAQLLGLYFFAYQATSAISAVVGPPLSKATMAELTRVEKSERIPLVWRFLILVTALVALYAALVGLASQPVLGLIGERWAGVLAPLVILLSSLPARFILPVTEALFMVSAKWRRSTSINFMDAAGVALSAFIALVILEGDVAVLAACITFWQVGYGNIRAIFALPGHRVLTLITIVLPNTLVVVFFATSVMQLGYLHWIAFLCVLVITGAQLVVFVVSARRARQVKA